VSEYPEFPREEAGQKIRFWAHVAGWAFQSAWIFFNRFPKWVRILVYAWLFIAVLAKGCNSPDEPSATGHSDKISPAAAKKLKEISDTYQGSSNKADIAKLATQIARAFSDEAGDGRPKAQSPILAIPFSAPSGDPAAKKLADSIFALVYGRVAISHHGHVGLTDEPLPSLDPGVVVERGRANHSTYVLYGAIDSQSAAQRFTVNIVTVADGAVVWSQSYPVAGADAAKIAAEVDSKVPPMEDD
jgi:TolB-like protein